MERKEVVSDTSTLILISKITLLDTLLQHVKVIIPIMVLDEACATQIYADAKLISQRVEEGKIQVKIIKNKMLAGKLAVDFNLGKGEAEAAALSLEEGLPLITDDKKAMGLCKVFHIEFTTALNLLVALYKSGYLSKEEAMIKFEKLALFGRYAQNIVKKSRGGLT